MILTFAETTTRDLRKQKQFATTVAVFYKNSDFENHSAQEKLKRPSNNIKDIYKLALEIFRKSYKGDKIRLIGLRLADLTTNNDYQLSFLKKKSLRKKMKFRKHLTKLMKNLANL